MTKSLSVKEPSRTVGEQLGNVSQCLPVPSSACQRGNVHRRLCTMCRTHLSQSPHISRTALHCKLCNCLTHHAMRPPHDQVGRRSPSHEYIREEPIDFDRLPLTSVDFDILDMLAVEEHAECYIYTWSRSSHWIQLKLAFVALDS